jgi:type IV pilus assembly protein PilE
MNTHTQEEAMKRRSRGLTMIEMMVSLVILGILGVLAYPAYVRYVTKTKRIEAQVAMIEALQQEEQYYTRNNTYIAFSSGALPAAPRFRWWSGSTATVSAYELDAQACPGRDLADCVQVRARPGTDRVDTAFRDPDCGTLTINSTGEHGASGAFDRCWP